MIEKTYRCDLCSEKIDHTDDKAGFRLKFISSNLRGGFVFCWLNDYSASEKIICHECCRKVAEQMELPEVLKRAHS